MGKNVSPAQVGDLELDAAKLESVENLTVYVNGSSRRKPRADDSR